MNNGFLVGNPMTVLAPLGLVCDPCAGTLAGFSPAKIVPRTPRRLRLRRVWRRQDGSACRRGPCSTNASARTTSTSARAASFRTSIRERCIHSNVANFSTNGVGTATSPIQPPEMTIWPSNNTMPSIYSWYVGIQQQLPAKFALDVSYSGSHSVHLMDQRQVNALPAGYLQNNQSVGVGQRLDQRASAVYRLGRPAGDRDATATRSTTP